MGFIAHKHDDGQPKPFEYLPAGEELTLVPGTALTFVDGALALAAGTVKPTYISEIKTTTVAGQIIPVSRVDGERIYETALSAADAALAPGALRTIDATGNLITATAAGGVAEVVSFDGKAAGDKVRVRF